MREQRLRVAWLAGGVALTLGVSLAPILYMVAVSLLAIPEGLMEGGARFTLHHYREVLSCGSLHVLDYLQNSVLVSATAALAGTSLATAAAYAICRLPFPGRTGVALGVLGCSLLPQISAVGWLYRTMAALGWINTLQALVLPYVAWCLPLGLWTMISYLGGIPPEIDRAARVDGAGLTKVILRIVLPLAAPGLVATFLLLFVFCFNEFLFALLLTTDWRAQTIPEGVAAFQGLHGELPWGHIMAASALASAPVVAITLAFQRRMVQGLTAGAVRG